MEIYNIIFYITIFIIGAFFGSFYTLAIHRIPKKQNITHTHSYCPNCNHKLGILDLIPIFSYLFLGGKCRYCKQKIRPRYFILEVISGFTFVALAYIMGIQVETLTKIKIIDYIFMVLYFTFIILISVIEKESRKIEKSLSIYGIIISLIYIVYLCIIEKASIYRYIIYLVFYVIILTLDTITLKKYAKNSYTNGILLTVITITIFTGEYITINTIIFVLLIIFTYMLLTQLKRRTRKYRSKIVDKEINKELPIEFYLGISNIITFMTVVYYLKIY